MNTLEFGEIAAWGLIAAAVAYSLGARRGASSAAAAAAALAALVTKGLLLSVG
jgi:hypothetical protein